VENALAHAKTRPTCLHATVSGAALTSPSGRREPTGYIAPTPIWRHPWPESPSRSSVADPWPSSRSPTSGTDGSRRLLRNASRSNVRILSSNIGTRITWAANTGATRSGMIKPYGHGGNVSAKPSESALPGHRRRYARVSGFNRPDPARQCVARVVGCGHLFALEITVSVRPDHLRWISGERLGGLGAFVRGPAGARQDGRATAEPDHAISIGLRQSAAHQRHHEGATR
jgi:hypothetical protein